MNVIIRVGLCAGEGAYMRGTYTWSNTSVKGKGELICREPIRGGGGGGVYRLRNKVGSKNCQ